MEEKTPLSGRWESAKGNQQVFRRTGPSPLGGHSLHKKDLQSSLLLPDLVLFLAVLMLAEAIHSTLLHDWSKDRISNRKSDRVCRAHWMVLKKRKPWLPLFPKQREAGKEAWLSTAVLFPGLLCSTPYAGFFIEVQPSPVYIPPFPPRP